MTKITYKQFKKVIKTIHAIVMIVPDHRYCDYFFVNTSFKQIEWCEDAYFILEELIPDLTLLDFLEFSRQHDNDNFRNSSHYSSYWNHLIIKAKAELKWCEKLNKGNKL